MRYLQHPKRAFDPMHASPRTLTGQLPPRVITPRQQFMIPRLDIDNRLRALGAYLCALTHSCFRATQLARGPIKHRFFAKPLLNIKILLSVAFDKIHGRMGIKCGTCNTPSGLLKAIPPTPSPLLRRGGCSAWIMPGMLVLGEGGVFL